MDIEVKDPDTGALLQLDAKPEQLEGIHGFRIRHPNGSGFFIANRSGTWRAADDHHINAHFLTNIGLALEGHKLHEQLVHKKYNSGGGVMKQQEKKNTKEKAARSKPDQPRTDQVLAETLPGGNKGAETEQYTDLQPNINSGMGDESIINPNEP